MNTGDLLKKLQAPFLPDEIEWRVGSTTQDKSKGLALAYVTNRAIQNRLDEVFGIAGWKNEFKDWKGNGVLCGISCKINDEWITKWDGAEETNMEATKGGLSDAMKRAGYQWGIGRYLYKLESQWVQLEPVGRSYRIKPGCEPKLPSWALPEGYTYTNKPPQQSGQGNPSGNKQDTPTGQNNASGDKPSKAQLDKINELCGQLLITDADGKKLLNSLFQKASCRDLSKQEASNFIKHLIAKVEESKSVSDFAREHRQMVNEILG